MSAPQKIVKLTTDQTWSRMRVEAATAAAQEPVLASFLHAHVLNHASFEDALSYRLAEKLADGQMSAMLWRDVCASAYRSDPAIVEAALADILACYARDPATFEYVQPFLYFKGYLSLQAHRVAHWLWKNERRPLAHYLQSRVSELLQVDIHPATVIGKGVFIDHASGVVIIEVGEGAKVAAGSVVLESVRPHCTVAGVPAKPVGECAKMASETMDQGL